MHAYDHMFAVHRVEKWFYKTKEFTDSIMRNAFFFVMEQIRPKKMISRNPTIMTRKKNSLLRLEKNTPETLNNTSYNHESYW